jgi:hypothetical protein
MLLLLQLLLSSGLFMYGDKAMNLSRKTFYSSDWEGYQLRDHLI